MFMNLNNIILSGMTIQQKLSWGGNGLVIGLGSVFIILVILIAVINLLKLSTKGKGSKKPVAAAPIVEKTVVKREEEDESEIIAVIAAAVNCMAAREGKRFAIKSFKRIGSRAKRSY